MADKTVTARIKRQREARAGEGWELVTVWVPSSEDAEDIRKQAAERRSRAESLEGLSRGVKSVTLQTEARIAAAIAKHGSAAYTTDSGAVLELMTELANEGDLVGFSRAVVIIARAKPVNAAFVIAAVPAKISNFLIRHRGISPTALLQWTNSNPSWADQLKNVVRYPERFEHAVGVIAEEIKQAAAH